MKSPTRAFYLHEITVGHARIGELDVAYAQYPLSHDHEAHWYVAVDDQGVALVQPFANGPLVPGKPAAGKDAIHARLTEVLARPRETDPARIVRAFEQGPWVQKDRMTSLDWLLNRGLRLKPGQGDEAEAFVAEAMRPATDRLGARAELADLYLAKRTRKSLAIDPGLDRDDAAARILRLSPAELPGLGSNLLKVILHEAAEMPDLRLDAPPEEIVRKALATLGVPEAATRRLPGPLIESAYLVSAMRTLPVDWLPQPEDLLGWKALLGLAFTLQDSRTSEKEWRRLLAPAKGDWPTFVERCYRAAFGRRLEVRYPALAAALRNADDVAKGFAAFLVNVAEDGPGVARKVAHLAHEAVVGERALPSILENSLNWHGRFSATTPANVTWEPLLPAWTDPTTGIDVVPLTGSNALMEEGEAMDHCVGGPAFSRDSLQDRTRIVSLRRGGERLSTAEIDLTVATPQDWNGGVLQHQGRENTEPSADAIAALREYMALPKVTLARTNASRNELRMPEGSEGDLASELERWRPYLTGTWRNATLDDFWEALTPDPELSSNPFP